MSTPESAFKNHKERARVRKIPFNFSYIEWIAWWEKQLGPNWFKLKNCGRGYVMARYKDAGPYAPHNVKCVHQLVNLSESRFGKLRGAQHPRCKITETIALDIKKSKLTCRQLAAQYGLSPGYVSEIRTGVKWGHLN